MSRMNTCEFRPFKRLPPEIRYEIWLTALTAWSVTVYATAPSVAGSALRPIYWNASAVGLVCYEAWSIMKKVCTKLYQISRVDRYVWVHFDTTVFFLGAAAEARNTIATFDMPLCRGLAHAAIVWTSWADVVGFFKHVSQNCSSLVSILIFDAGKPYIPEIPPLKRDSPDQMVAACKGVGRNYEPWWVDVPVLTEDLQSWFKPWPRQPSIIFLPL
ncbi:uncharacterized protein F4807DRAFT_440198 [Annulohypoxylon truncatum]|uniref:uncharacterized protein n=1 Tax=Annulohypoxylon truncatum TaxID=327061 RepID=UPI0020075A19|nr:uncharacterized protein F4807DRAFT_440198 [Annulohypoxylon truncatum]KAI1206187.1 hypothetical protein F4807DRAFT_440198 [Annulohypoxylon truncatum]